MIIDAHTHISVTDYGNIDLYKAWMEKAGIDKAILFPGGTVDVRRLTRYIALKEKLVPAPIPNDLIAELIAKQPDMFRGFINIDPLGDQQSNLAEFEKRVLHQGFVGLKLAPLIHQFSFSSSMVKDLAAMAGELGVPVYAHTLFAPGASTEKYAFLASQFPGTNFILGHIGFGPADIDAIELTAKHDNLYLETSGASYLIIEQAYMKLGDSKIIYGSEFPLQNPVVELEKIRLICEEKIENIVCNNIMSLIKKDNWNE